MEQTVAPEATFLRAASGCGTEFQELAWTGSVAVHLRDETYLGVQFNDQALQELVVEALGDRAVTGLEVPRVFYSLRLGVANRRTREPLHYLYEGTKPVLGTRDVHRLVHGLESHLSQHVADDASDHLTVRAVPVQTHGGVVLAPHQLLGMARIVDRVLRPQGVLLADVPAATLDLAAGTVTVPTPTVPLDLGRDRLAGVAAPVEEQRLEPGTYPLAGWLLPVDRGELGPLRPAQATVYAGRLVRPLAGQAHEVLSGLAELAHRVPVLGVDATRDEATVQAVGAFSEVTGAV